MVEKVWQTSAILTMIALRVLSQDYGSLWTRRVGWPLVWYEPITQHVIFFDEKVGCHSNGLEMLESMRIDDAIQGFNI